MKQLKSLLKEFKLAWMSNSLEERISYANDNKLSYKQFLELLCEDEENNRRDNSYKKRYGKAKLPCHKTIEEFDFNFQPSIDKKQINDAVMCQYIKEKRNIIFIGNPGTGKSHLSMALWIKALLKDYKVLFTTVSDMLYKLLCKEKKLMNFLKRNKMNTIYNSSIQFRILTYWSMYSIQNTYL